MMMVARYHTMGDPTPAPPTGQNWRELVAAIIQRAIDDAKTGETRQIRNEASFWLATTYAGALFDALDIDQGAALAQLGVGR